MVISFSHEMQVGLVFIRKIFSDNIHTHYAVHGASAFSIILRYFPFGYWPGSAEKGSKPTHEQHAMCELTCRPSIYAVTMMTRATVMLITMTQLGRHDTIPGKCTSVSSAVFTGFHHRSISVWG